ncbi:MAG: PQQ-dependent sugar dehydrogenase, partial [Verrucomicrobiota bacterium]
MPPLRVLRILAALLVTGLAAPLDAATDQPSPTPSGPEADGPFRKVPLDADHDANGDGRVDDTLVNVMEIAVARDGRVYLAERAGVVKVLEKGAAHAREIGRVPVFNGLEDGLLGIALDPGFDRNRWLYLYYADPVTRTNEAGLKTGENRLARFTVADGRLDPASERILLRVPTQRDDCCHSGGSLAFDGAGNLYLSTGDNTH